MKARNHRVRVTVAQATSYQAIPPTIPRGKTMSDMSNNDLQNQAAALFHCQNHLAECDTIGSDLRAEWMKEYGIDTSEELVFDTKELSRRFARLSENSDKELTAGSWLA